MVTVETINGAVDVDALGLTLMHEHVFVRTPEVQEAFPGFMGWDDERAVSSAQERLRALKASGVDTIVDLTAPGLGRDVHLISRAVEGTDLQVLLVTGWYTVSELPWPFRLNGPGRLFDDPTDKMLVDLFVADIVNGIQGTSIKAAAIKCATDEPGVTVDVERVIRAVARAHLTTDVPIMTHALAPMKRGLDQQRILADEGVDLRRVVIGHSNESNDLSYLTALMDAGSYIGFDRCGQDIRLDLDAQATTLAKLCDLGYADRIVLSHDRHCQGDWFTEEDIRDRMPQWQYEYLGEFLLPAVRELGVSDDQIDQMMRINPREFFAARTATMSDSSRSTSSGQP